MIPESGCQECGNCVHVLLNDTDELESLIEPIQNDIQGTSSSVLSNRKLEHMKSKYKNYTKLFMETFEETPERTKRLTEFATVKKNLDELSDKIEKLDFKVKCTFFNEPILIFVLYI